MENMLVNKLKETSTKHRTALTNLEKIVQDGHRYYQQSYSEKKAIIDERNFSLPAIRTSPQESYQNLNQSYAGPNLRNLNRNISPIGPSSGNLKEYLTEIAQKSARKKNHRNLSKGSSQGGPERSGAMSLVSGEDKKGHFAVPHNFSHNNAKE